MDTLAVVVALSLACAGCACFYLTSPHQGWRAAPLPPAPARAIAVLMWLASLYAFTCALSVVPAVFTFITTLMFLFVAFPYLGAALLLARRGALT